MVSDDNPLHWNIHLLGPEGTLYEQGIYQCLFRFPKDYPFSPPSVQFQSQILHPNIYKDGKVCITSLQTAVPDNLRDKDSCPKNLNWNPSIGVAGALLGCVSLLSEPNFDDPANTDAAVLLKDNPDVFKERCRKHVERSLKEIAAVANWRHPNEISTLFLEKKIAKERALNGGSKDSELLKNSQVSDSETYEYSEDESDEEEEDEVDAEGDSQMSEAF